MAIALRLAGQLGLRQPLATHDDDGDDGGDGDGDDGGDGNGGDGDGDGDAESLLYKGELNHLFLDNSTIYLAKVS